MKKTSTSLLLALALALLAGCSPSDTGSAQLAVSVSQALTSPISRVSVTASAAEFPSVSVDLVFSHGVWGGFLSNIPAGSHRTFLAQAFDASGTQLFEGSVSGVSIVADQTALVALTLKQVNAPPPFQNAAPIIDSLVASSTSTSIPASSALSLLATVHDPNAGDTLSYAWSATAGSFSSSSAASTSWTAPASAGIQTLTLTVTDPGGLSSSISLAVNVTPRPLLGNAQFSLAFNSFPQVASLSSSLTRLTVGQTTSVSASVSDLDGDSLTYAWSASCAGSWANATSSSAQFTPSEYPSGTCNNCRLRVSVSDGRGGQSTGALALCVSRAPAPQHFNPVILSASGSSGMASPDQVLTYEVVASDAEGSALSFSWTIQAGTLSTPVNTTSSSRITWTAPACVAASDLPLTATVTNAFNLKATQRFSVSGLPACPGGWTLANSMNTIRSAHTATLLLNGKVLIAGGGGSSGSIATAQVYDPASGTWSDTGSMLSARYRHTATRLPDGKVLVAGGYSVATRTSSAEAEVYDPASGTWSATGAMISPRSFHTATLLTTGKVLVTGGESGGILATAEVYDPATGTWSATGTMALSRSLHTATLLNTGKVLVAAGVFGSNNLATAEVYDPASGTWSAAGSMGSPRYSPTATLLNNGKVLVAGGYGSSNLVAAEVYDPASGTWSAAGSMASFRIHPTATLLPDGTVLIAGGQGTSDNLATAEVYDPATGTWSATGTMTWSRQAHTATLLNNGRVLVVGSNAGMGCVTAELYTPSPP
jgi:N-acetylneuraminic acid mutarotase